MGAKNSTHSEHIYYPFTRRVIAAFLIDETMVQIGHDQEAWLWVTVEPVHRSTGLGVYISIKT
jgi:hypothetical protein